MYIDLHYVFNDIVLLYLSICGLDPDIPQDASAQHSGLLHCCTTSVRHPLTCLLKIGLTGIATLASENISMH